VETIAFEYGQRHAIELTCRDHIFEGIKKHFPNWAKNLKEDYVLSLPSLQALSETALTKPTEIALTSSGIPNTFVPGRNILFLTYAAAYGYRHGIEELVGGMCETDFSGYPDCRNDTIQTLASALSKGLEKDISIHTPLMQLTKAATWQMAYDLGGEVFVDMIINNTHTCYLGVRDKAHDWGYGCGTCPACMLRKKGYERYKSKDIL
jgi:7-cyano-7-deazaguanine synthase